LGEAVSLSQEFGDLLDDAILEFVYVVSKCTINILYLKFFTVQLEIGSTLTPEMSKGPVI
jgi:hypothetical protein